MRISKGITVSEKSGLRIGQLVEVTNVYNQYGTRYKTIIKTRPRPGRDNYCVTGFKRENWDVYDQEEIE